MLNPPDLISTSPLSIAPNTSDVSAAFFERRKKVDSVLQIRLSRNTSIALIISLVVHLLLLIALAPKLFPEGKPISTPQPLTVNLNPPSKSASKPAEPAAVEPPVEITKPTKKSAIVKPTPIPRVITATKPSTQSAANAFKVPPIVIPKKLPKSAPDTPAEPLPGEDMQAYTQRMQDNRQHKQGYTSKDLAEGNPDNGPSEDRRRNRAIAENMKFGGSNGIFEIKNIGLNSAQFNFKGWKNNNVSRAISENIDVSVPDGGDVKLAIIRKMIAIIRREYKGDFNWESRRLDRVIVMSARPEDNDGLESFLMKEFFGPGGAYRE